MLLIVLHVGWGYSPSGLAHLSAAYHSDKRANKLVTKMVANARPRAGVERDETGRAVDFSNTNQYLSAQNKTGRDDRQQISSAVLSIASHR
jgi:hypothetical protein